MSGYAGETGYRRKYGYRGEGASPPSLAAVQYLGFSNVSSASGTSVSVNVPAGAQEGDILVAIINLGNVNPGTDGFGDLDGFTLIDLSAAVSFGSPIRAQGILWRALPSTPPASYTPTLTKSTESRRVGVLLRGAASPLAPIHDWAVTVQVPADGVSITTPAVDVPVGGLVIACSRQDTSSVITLDAALTSIASSSNAPSSITIHAGYEADATPGAARTFTNAHQGTARDKVMHAIVIR